MVDGDRTILLVEDNDGDVLLLKHALQKNDIRWNMQVAKDGVEAVEYLQGVGAFSDRAKFPLPDVMILDLNMPRMTGLELLEWLRVHPEFKTVPTLVLSSSKHQRDVAEAYAKGANSYMVKAASFDDFQALTRMIHDYWVRCVVPGRT